MKSLLIVFLLNWIPLLEARFAIPYGIIALEQNFYLVVILSSIAGILLAGALLKCLPWGINFVERFVPFLHKIKERIFQKTRAKYDQKMEIAGSIALVTLVTIPLPGSGVFTGSLVAYLFGIPFKRAWCLIGLGVTLSCIIIGLLTLTGQGLWDLLA